MATMSSSFSASQSMAASQTMGPSQRTQSTSSTATTSQNFSTLVSTIVNTTGKEPPPLVGSSTTIVNDTLYVFGGRVLSRTRPQLTCDMYALDLITRVWTRLETKGAIPPPRYFHSVCALGDSKLVCFGGMSPASANLLNATPQKISSSHESGNEVVVMADIHIYDIASRTWSYIPTSEVPEGRYAHCATILASSATFTNNSTVAATVLAGKTPDGLGGAEMVVVGGQDSENHYIEEINVFNLRSLKWTGPRMLGRSCGAYRSVVSPLPRGMTTQMIGAGLKAYSSSSNGIPPLGGGGAKGEDPMSLSAVGERRDPSKGGHGMLIYSNYNFLDVKLELQVRLPDGTLEEKPMVGPYSPPGLRFPNGGVIDSHFVVSGTYLTSSKQEYALWALDLRTLIWSRIDVGSVFTQGSWNRGVLWAKRNTFIILGRRDRSLVDDYNHRRINFSHLCMVELEAFGLYDNPRYHTHPSLQRCFSTPAQELGRLVLGMRHLADMEFLAVGGERVPVNSRIVARRWGPYFIELLNASNPPSTSPTTASFSAPSKFLTSAISAHNPHYTNPSSSNPHYSTATITPQTIMAANQSYQQKEVTPPTPVQLSPLTRPRTLYLPHTHQTLLTLVHFLYTSTLPPPSHPQSSPQILCSLLQIARPYRVEGLLEAVVERLHQALDGKNAAAVFNAAAMAAGGGASIFNIGERRSMDAGNNYMGGNITPTPNANGGNSPRMPAEGDGTLPGESWGGVVSSVIGLQKRGLRGLMEGRRMRERGRSIGTRAEGTAPGMGNTFGS